MKTTYERGIELGIERGIEQGERRSTIRLMEAKFGPLSPEVKQQVERLSPEALARLQLDLLGAKAPEELRRTTELEIPDTQRFGEIEAAMDGSLGENGRLATLFPARFHL